MAKFQDPSAKRLGTYQSTPKPKPKKPRTINLPGLGSRDLPSSPREAGRNLVSNVKALGKTGVRLSRKAFAGELPPKYYLPPLMSRPAVRVWESIHGRSTKGPSIASGTKGKRRGNGRA